MNLIKRYWGVIIILTLSFLILTRIFHAGFFVVHDDVQPSRIFEMTKSLKDGMFPVRWVQDLGFGYGYPVFNFYAPFPYYLGSFFNLLGFDEITSAKIMYGIPVILAGFGMYFFISSFLGIISGTAAAVVYLLFPYFALNIFIRGAVGEYYSYALLPFIFWVLFKIYYRKNKSSRYIPSILTSIMLALLIISHNLSAYMLGIIFTIFILFSIIFSKYKKYLTTHYLIILLLAFLLTSFYTLPALLEMKFTDVKSQLTGNFNYSNHFICPVQFWDSPWGFAGSTKGCTDDGLSFRLGKSNIIFTVLGIIIGLYIFIFKKKIKYNFLFLFSAFLLVFSLFMTTVYSQLIWKILPDIEFLQFPWRFLNFTGFAMSVVIGFLIFIVKQKNHILGILLFIFIIIGTTVLNLKLFNPQQYINRISSYYTDVSKLNFTHSSITSEYMPSDFIRPDNLSQVPASSVDIINGKGEISISENNTANLRFIVNLKESGVIRINKAYFPAWKLYVNNKEKKIKKIPKGIIITLENGKYDIRLEFVQTPIETAGNILSLTGVLAVFIGIIAYRKEIKHGKKVT